MSATLTLSVPQRAGNTERILNPPHPRSRAESGSANPHGHSRSCQQCRITDGGIPRLQPWEEVKATRQGRPRIRWRGACLTVVSTSLSTSSRPSQKGESTRERQSLDWSVKRVPSGCRAHTRFQSTLKRATGRVKSAGKYHSRVRPSQRPLETVVESRRPGRGVSLRDGNRSEYGTQQHLSSSSDSQCI